MGATDSLTELYASIRAQLLSYNDGGPVPNTINAAVGGRVYNEAPPEPVVAPYVLLTIDGNTPLGGSDPTRIEIRVEVQVIHEPRTKIVEARRIADLAWKALAGYRVATAGDGFVTLRVPPLPSTMPPGSGDASREVVQIIITADGYAYSKALATVTA